jgi:hypothetical protein
MLPDTALTRRLLRQARTGDHEAGSGLAPHGLERFVARSDEKSPP